MMVDVKNIKEELGEFRCLTCGKLLFVLTDNLTPETLPIGYTLGKTSGEIRGIETRTLKTCNDGIINSLIINIKCTRSGCKVLNRFTIETPEVLTDRALGNGITNPRN